MARTDVPPRLYKYGQAKRVQDILGGHIRFTQAAALNDPFELEPVFDLIRSSSDLLNDVMSGAPRLLREAVAKRHAMMSRAERARLPLKKLQAIALDAVVAKNLLPLARAVIEPAVRAAFVEVQGQLTTALRNELGVLSLTDDPLNVLMWSHYGDEHRGVAIEFDTANAWFDRRRSDTDECFHLRQVRYIDLNERERTFLQIAEENVLIAKALSWAYEREWRMLAPIAAASEKRVVPDATDPIYLFEIDRSAIAGIVLGMRVADETVRSISALIKGRTDLAHIRLRQVSPARGTASLSVHDIEYTAG